MVELASNISRSRMVEDLSVLGVFMISGFLSGLLFALFVTRPGLQAFFYIKGDKFLIPRYSYWFAFSLIYLLGLIGGYLVCCWRKWLRHRLSSRGRLLAVALIIGLATPFLRLMTPLMNAFLGLTWDFVGAPIGFLVLISLALCVLTGSLRFFPIALLWSLVFAVAGFVLVYAGVRIFSATKTWYEFVQWPILESMLALSFANWIIWRQRAADGGRHPTSASS
jgi:hypothetical protein